MMEQVKSMYSEIRMPVETEQKIRSAMALRQKKCLHWPILKRIGALAAVFVLMVALSPTARAAVNDWVVKYFWPDSDITIYEKTDEKGDAVGITAVDTDAPGFARIVNGRLYFVGNGERIDITDQITEEKPFVYTYADDYGLTHYMAVGFSGSIENFGIYEFMWDGDKGEWVTGTGRNFLSAETQTRYPWVDIIWKEWNIPWPMPE